MTDSSKKDMSVIAPVDAVMADSRLLSVLRRAIDAPAHALEGAYARRLLAPVIDLDAASQVRAAGSVVIIAVLTHTVALAWLGVSVHVLGWSARGVLIAAGLLLARRPFAVLAAWKEKNGESPRCG